jgi:hypothetical protein
MIGFGAMDNFIMIQAGEAIDISFGVAFGLSTLTAAAMGQVVSDFSGVCFGSTVEAMAGKLGLPASRMTLRQMQLKVSRLAGTAGAAIGVVLGCLIGMTSLLFIDTQKIEKMKRREQVAQVEDKLCAGAVKLLDCERCTFFYFDKDTETLQSSLGMNKNVKSAVEHRYISMPIDIGIAGLVARTRKTVVTANAYKHASFDNHFDEEEQGFSTKTIACGPVTGADGRLLGVIQFLNKKDGKVFTEQDERLLLMICQHTAVFMEEIGEW